jgi:hypothetical protein
MPITEKSVMDRWDRVIAWILSFLAVSMVGLMLIRDWTATAWSTRGNIIIAGIVSVWLVWQMAEDGAKRRKEICPHCGSRR